MAATHQQIVDQLESLAREHDAAHQALRARFGVQAGRLQHECGALGHIWSWSRDSLALSRSHRICCVCAAQED